MIISYFFSQFFYFSKSYTFIKESLKCEVIAGFFRFWAIVACLGFDGTQINVKFFTNNLFLYSSQSVLDKQKYSRKRFQRKQCIDKTACRRSRESFEEDITSWFSVYIFQFYLLCWEISSITILHDSYLCVLSILRW